MDELFGPINPNKCVKPYSKVQPVEKSVEKVPQNQLHSPNVLKSEPLTTRNAVKFLLEGSLKSKVCRYCLNVAPYLSELEQILHVADKGNIYKVSIKDMVASFHPFKVVDNPDLPNKICDKCVDRTISSYLYTQQCERAERALRNFFEDIYEKFEKLDSLDRPKHKRGRQKLNPNYNTLYAEHNNVIDYADPIIHIINTSTESLTTAQPRINELECMKCCEVLPNLTSLLNHTKIHPKSMWYNCRLCGKSFPKCHLLKKHWRCEHSTRKYPKEPKKEETIKYDCKKCGMVTENYYDYLQHIEKHKFKMVMEHLVDRKMDKLCSTCLNKESNMVSLDKKICLHGGCPELTGDRPLYNVLALTLPETKNYKYQELLVPTQAKRDYIYKKTRIENLESTEFSFANPNILVVEDLDCDKSYLFFFAEPLMNTAEMTEINENEVHVKKEYEQWKKELVNDNQILNAPEAGKVDTQSIKSTESERDAFLDVPNDLKKTSEEPTKFKFRNPDYIELETECDKVQLYEVDKLEQIKDNSWIFDKCLENDDNANRAVTFPNGNIPTNIESKNSKIPCNSCWMFKDLDKCEICQEVNININSNNIFQANIHINTIEMNNKDIRKETRIEKVAPINTTKTKTTWHCNICLIDNNNDRQMCSCCEAIFPSNKEVLNFTKIICNKNELNINIDNNNEDNNINTNVDNAINPNIEKNNEIVKTNTLDSGTSFEMKNPSSFHFPNDMTFNNIKVPNIGAEEISHMDTAMIEEENAVKFSNLLTDFEHEAMDIEEIEMPIVDSHYNMSNFVLNEIIRNTNNFAATNTSTNNNTFTTKPIQFAIGTGSEQKETRKCKRALRNVNRAFHK